MTFLLFADITGLKEPTSNISSSILMQIPVIAVYLAVLSMNVTKTS